MIGGDWESPRLRNGLKVGEFVAIELSLMKAVLFMILLGESKLSFFFLPWKSGSTEPTEPSVK